jgi:hypothetical protein
MKLFGNIFSKCNECFDLKDNNTQEFEEYAKCKIKFFQCLKVREGNRDQFFSFIIVILGLAIPALNALLPEDHIILKNQLSVIIGSGIAIIIAFLQIKKYHERFIIFKFVSRSLEIEYIKFKNKVFSDSDDKNLELFRDKVFEILYNEVDQVVSIFKNMKKDDGKIV